MKTLAYTAFLAIATMAAACSKSSENTGVPALATATVTFADSMVYGKSTAEITINGQYPLEGAPTLIDSTRQWLAECLSWGTYSNEKPLIVPSRAQIADGARLVDHLGKKLLAASKRDFIYLAGDSLSAGYEYQINFAPAFQSDSLVTYEYSTYCYQGGAHGNSIQRVATFTVPKGRVLTYGNVFLPDRQNELLAKVRDGLWTQYFKPAFEGEDVTLREALLIDPDSLQLPICGPQFGPKGVTFTYGQYEIAPYSAGMPACTLPYSALRPLMQPAVLPLLPSAS